MTEMGSILKLLRLERTVADLARTAQFYCEALGFSILERGEQIMKLTLGAEQIWLTKYDPPGSPYPHNSISSDIWFQHAAIVTSDMEAAFAKLQQYPHIPISRNGPQQLPPETGSVRAYKFRDPEGHPLELIQFPSGIGEVQWQSKMSLNLGIDHSAIVVSNAERSLAFYTDLLGMTLMSRQTNRGFEQEQLDALPLDIVDVIALAPSHQMTPHLELLAYQSPQSRPSAITWGNSDILGDRLVFEVNDLMSIFNRMNKIQCKNDVDTIDPLRPMIHDPDGHLLIFVQA